MFFKGSRYAEVETLEISDSKGRLIPCKKIRLIPESKAKRGHVTVEGERLDHVSHRYFRDPELFWLICDANRALWPDDLVAEPGVTILIPTLEG